MPTAVSRVVMAVAYDGSGFHGWQRQRSPEVATVQAALESALSKVADENIVVQCAGRTDTGVHASYQVVHFETTALRPLRAWTRGSNTHLPEAVKVLWAQAAGDDFHARFSATARRYRYLIYNAEHRPAHLTRGVTWIREPLDAALMAEAGRHLIGELDFSAFRSAQCESPTPMRNVIHLNVERFGDVIMIDIKANAFLHHMVRNIAGVLMAIGSGERAPDWAAQVLAGRDRTQGGVTARPEGLYLVAVDYPPQFGLPDSQPGPWFVSAFSDR